MTMPNNPEALLRDKINRETSRMAWTELLRHFAAGTVIVVSDDLDLVDVAVHMSNDDHAAVAQWLSENRIGKVSDAQAQEWLEADLALWAVVVRPWILVQREKPV
ncbi:MAG: DUF2288 domain-containing protein [Pseudomonadota bacterium]